MNKTTLFMKAILGIGLAGAITLGASGCNSTPYETNALSCQ